MERIETISEGAARIVSGAVLTSRAELADRLHGEGAQAFMRYMLAMVEMWKEQALIASSDEERMQAIGAVTAVRRAIDDVIIQLRGRDRGDGATPDGLPPHY